ncbi:MAG: hypothetical protein ACQEXJ_23095 [Myxococcota bacterium]
MSDHGSLNTSLTVSDDEAHITMGDLELTVPVDRIEALVRVLEAASIIAESPMAGPREGGAVAGEGVVRKTARMAERTAKRAGRARKRRSRKRVGDALVVWLQQNPGWHHEEDLLEAVVDNRMTDANPKRALKIALGKQKDDLFETDGKGHWKLLTDKQAGPPPRAKGRRKGARKKATSASAAPRTGARRHTPSAPGGKLAEATKGISRSGRRVRLRTKPRSATGEESPTDTQAQAEAKLEARGGRVVRVRKGQRRKEVTRPRDRTESEKKAAEQARGGSSAQSARWNIPEDQLERARRNLLSLGSKGTPVKEESPSGEDESKTETK